MISCRLSPVACHLLFLALPTETQIRKPKMLRQSASAPRMRKPTCSSASSRWPRCPRRRTSGRCLQFLHHRVDRQVGELLRRAHLDAGADEADQLVAAVKRPSSGVSLGCAIGVRPDRHDDLLRPAALAKDARTDVEVRLLRRVLLVVEVVEQPDDAPAAAPRQSRRTSARRRASPPRRRARAAAAWVNSNSSARLGAGFRHGHHGGMRSARRTLSTPCACLGSPRPP